MVLSVRKNDCRIQSRKFDWIKIDASSNQLATSKSQLSVASNERNSSRPHWLPNQSSDNVMNVIELLDKLEQLSDNREQKLARIKALLDSGYYYSREAAEETARILLQNAQAISDVCTD